MGLNLKGFFMATVGYNSLEASKRLKKGDFSEKQAEATVEVLDKMIIELASKEDVSHLGDAVRKEIKNLDKSFKKDIESQDKFFESKLNQSGSELREKMTYRFGGMMFGIFVSIASILFFVWNDLKSLLQTSIG